MTPRVPNPKNPSRYTIKMCYRCGKPISEEEKKTQVTRKSRHKRAGIGSKFYHKECWDELFI
jgi:hypothetical protein